MRPAPGLPADQVLAFVLLDVAIILIAARLLGAVARKVGQPTVVGEIVAGVLLGPTLLGRTVFAWDKPWEYLNCPQALTAPPGGEPSITACVFPPQARSVLGILGQIALVLFMFLVGLELDWSSLKGRAKGIALVAFGAVAIPIGLGMLLGPVLYDSKFVGGFGTANQPSETTFSLFIAAMLSVTAFPVMARILQEKGLTKSAMGSIGIASAAVVTVLMFLTVAAAAGAAADQGPSSLITKYVVAGVYIAVLFLVVRPALAPLGRAYDRQGSLTPGIFAAIVILLFASAYTAHKIGINVIVGGFMLGAILPARQALFRDMAARLSDFTAIVLLPIFLAFSGLSTDFTKLGTAFIPGLALFLAAGIVGKWLGSALFAKAGGLSWAEGNAVGILMNCRGLLVLVVGLIGFNLGVISAPMQVGGVVMALVTTMMTGPLFDWAAKRIPAEPRPEAADVAPAGAGYRVLAAFDDLDRAPLVAHAALTVVGDRRPAEVVLFRPFPLPQHDELLSGINDEMLEAQRSVRSLMGLAAFAPSGVLMTPVAYASVDPMADLRRLAESRGCDAVVVAWDPQLAQAQGWQRLDGDLPCPMVLVGPSAGRGPEGSPVRLVEDDATSSPVTQELARQVAISLGVAVERQATLDQSQPASAVVVELALDRASAADEMGRLVAAARCPVYAVRLAAQVGVGGLG